VITKASGLGFTFGLREFQSCRPILVERSKPVSQEEKMGAREK